MTPYIKKILPIEYGRSEKCSVSHVLQRERSVNENCLILDSAIRTSSLETKFFSN